MVETSSKDGYAAWASSYDNEVNPLIGAEEPNVEKILKRIKFSRVLDAATGTGRLALKIAKMGASVTAFDESEEMLSVARAKADDENLDIDLSVGSLENSLNYDSETFDLVVCALALTHLNDINFIVSEFYRVLKKDGYLLITDFHPDAVAAGFRTEFTNTDDNYSLPNVPHKRADYLNAIKKADFREIEITDIPTRDIPKECIPERYVEVVKEHQDTNCCLICLAKK
jgi:ubiquinone/menaquinone biosynthesis C-methylase UbiE